MNKRKINGWYKLRWEVLERDNFSCQYCGRTAPDVELEVDHRIPIADGGTNELDNLVASCGACNRGKSGLRQSLLLSKAREIKKTACVNAQTSEIEQLLREHLKGLSVKDIASRLKLKDNNTRVFLSKLKKKGKVDNAMPGIWTIMFTQVIAEPAPGEAKKAVCPACNGMKFIEVRSDKGIAYKPCPDCNTKKNKK